MKIQKSYAKTMKITKLYFCHIHCVFGGNADAEDNNVSDWGPLNILHQQLQIDVKSQQV